MTLIWEFVHRDITFLGMVYEESSLRHVEFLHQRSGFLALLTHSCLPTAFL
jgi:hypothetical protein